MICISCGYEHDEKFCPNCGEKRDTKKITFQSLLKTSISGIIDMDRGFLLNVKELFLSPRKMIIEYIKGRRKGIFNPLSYLILTTTFYIIIDSYLKSKGDIKTPSIVHDQELYDISYRIGGLIRKYLKFFWVLCIFPFAFFNKLFFKRYNFWEHLTIAAFLFGQATLVGLIISLFYKTALIFNPLVYITLLILNYSVFHNKKNKTESIILVFTSMFFYAFSLIMIMVALVYFTKQTTLN